jgi:hypothetical protein
LALFGDGDAGERILLEDGREVRRFDALHRREYQSLFGPFALERAVYTVEPDIRTADEVLDALFHEAPPSKPLPTGPTPFFKYVPAALQRDAASAFVEEQARRMPHGEIAAFAARNHAP